MLLRCKIFLCASKCIKRKLPLIVTMSTPETDFELLLFLRAIRYVHPFVPIAIGCNNDMLRSDRGSAAYAEFRFCPNIKWHPILDRYGKICRKTMESLPGLKYKTLHCDMMMEKANLLENVLAQECLLSSHEEDKIGTSMGAFFLDCDVIVLDSLPDIDAKVTLGLSHHEISLRDELIFGAYNGGFVFFRDPSLLECWRNAAESSRFYDQSALEAVADTVLSKDKSQFMTFSSQCNFGFWRIFQQPDIVDYQKKYAKCSDLIPESLEKFPLLSCSDETVNEYNEKKAVQQFCNLIGMVHSGVINTLSRFSFEREICLDQKPLQSIHTHLLATPNMDTSKEMILFNHFITNAFLQCVNNGNSGVYKIILETLADLKEKTSAC